MSCSVCSDLSFLMLWCLAWVLILSESLAWKTPVTPLASGHLFILKTSCTLIWLCCFRFCLRDVGHVLWSYMMPR